MLITENGTGLANADSYISVEDASDYLDARVHDDRWSNLDQTAQERYLRAATSYIDTMFNHAGSRASSEQNLAYPRQGHSSVPRAVQNATALLAYESVTTALYASVNDQKVLSESLLDGMTETTYFAPITEHRFPAVEAMLADVATFKKASGITVTRIVRD